MGKRVAPISETIIFNTNNNSKIGPIETNNITTYLPESIYLTSKTLGNLWKISLPIVEKI